MPKPTPAPASADLLASTGWASKFADLARKAAEKAGNPSAPDVPAPSGSFIDSSGLVDPAKQAWWPVSSSAAAQAGKSIASGEPSNTYSGYEPHSAPVSDKDIDRLQAAGLVTEQAAAKMRSKLGGSFQKNKFEGMKPGKDADAIAKWQNSGKASAEKTAPHTAEMGDAFAPKEDLGSSVNKGAGKQIGSAAGKAASEAGRVREVPLPYAPYVNGEGEAAADQGGADAQNFLADRPGLGSYLVGAASLAHPVTAAGLAAPAFASAVRSSADNFFPSTTGNTASKSGAAVAAAAPAAPPPVPPAEPGGSWLSQMSGAIRSAAENTPPAAAPAPAAPGVSPDLAAAMAKLKSIENTTWGAKPNQPSPEMLKAMADLEAIQKGTWGAGG